MAVGDVLTDEEMAARSGAIAARPSGPPPDVLSDDEVRQRLASGPSMLQSFGRGALEGATFGFEDELGLADRRRQAASREANPWTHFMGELAGGLAPMALAWLLPGGQPLAAARTGNLLYRGANLARRALLPGEISTLAQAVGQGSKLGAVYGGLSGAGHTAPAETDSLLSALGQRAIGTAKGAAVGTVMGGPLGGVLYGGSRALGAVINRASPALAEAVQAARHPESQGIRDFLRNMGYDRYTVDDLRALRQALADPANRARFADLNLIEALESRPLATVAGTGELRPPVAVSSNLRSFAQDAANTQGVGRQEAVEAFASRSNQMSARIQEDINRLFQPLRAMTPEDELAMLGRNVDRAFGSGNQLADEAAMAARRAALDKRYARLRREPLVLNEELADMQRIPGFRAALEYAATNDMIATSAAFPGSRWGQLWSKNTQAGLPGYQGVTLSPNNILDIHHYLVTLAKPPLGTPTAESLNMSILKKGFANWADRNLRGFGKVTEDYAAFKRLMDAQELGGSLPVTGGGQRHPSLVFLDEVLRGREQAARTLQQHIAQYDAAMQRYQAGRIQRPPAPTNLNNGISQVQAYDDIAQAFRRNFGERLKSDLGQSGTADAMVQRLLTPEGQQRVMRVLGARDGANFLNFAVSLQARRHGASLGLAAGGSDHAALQFFRQAERAAASGNLLQAQGGRDAIDVFRRAWGNRIKDELAASTDNGNRVVRQLLTQQGKERVLAVLGPEAGREFIESLYNKAAQMQLGRTLFGNSDTAYKLARQKKTDAFGDIVHGLWSLRPMQILTGLRDIGSSAFTQRRMDQANTILSRQGPAEVSAILDAILARQQLRTSGHPYLAAPGIRVLGPLAGTIPAYQNPVPPQRRRQP